MPGSTPGSGPWMRESPTARWKVNAGASSRDVRPDAWSAATVRRKRAIATANGLRSTPWIASRAAWTRAWSLQAGGVLVPAVQQSVEGAEQEVAGPAGRVDELEAFERAFLQGWFQGAVEDEFLDEDRGLQQRVGVLGVLGQVLVQVAEETGGQRRVRKVVDERRRPRRGCARSRAAWSPRHRTATPDAARSATRPAPSSRAAPPGSRSLTGAIRGRCPRGGSGRTRAGRRALPAGGPPGPAIQTGPTSALSSQNRMNTVVSTHATAAWVIRSSRQATQDAAVRSLSSGPLVLLLPPALPLGVGREPVAQVVFQEQDLPLQVGGQGGGRGHDVPSAAVTAGRESIHSASRRKNWPGAASGSGRLSMMAPWLPGSCGTSTQMACGRRAARSVHWLSMARWPYRASGAISVSRTGRVPSGAPAQRRGRSRPRRRAGCAGPARPARPRPGCPPGRRRRPGPCPRAGRPRPPAPAWRRSARRSRPRPPRRTGRPAPRWRGRCGRRPRRGRGTTGWPRSPPAGARTGRR